MLADGTITARIHATIQPDQIGEMREKLRNGGFHGKVAHPLLALPVNGRRCLARRAHANLISGTPVWTLYGTTR